MSSSAISSSYQQFLNNVNNLQAKLTKAQNQVSSGLKVTEASDAPDQISSILQLHANIAQNQQIQTNLTTVKSDVQTADSSLGTGITLLDQVQTLAAEGLNGTNQTAATRTTLAGQIESLMQQMVSISQTAVNGSYIFSGDSDQTASYKYDSTAATGVDRQQISDSTRQVQDTSGNTFAVSLSANQIFDVRDANDNPTTGNVFAAMNAVRTALLNNDTTSLNTAVSQVSDASTYLNQQQSFYGGVENTITSALDQASTQSLNYQTELSNKQDADETASILAMQQYTTSLQAALTSEAKIPHQTLFDLMGS
jgi:flagellar hook-associated protein 3 FlgL